MSTKTSKPSRQKSATASLENTVASLHVSLPQMLDLALGTPEVGAVNFNILHNFLHVVLHQINLRTTKVEYRGEDANRIKTMVASLNEGPSLHLHEYIITDSSGKVKQRIHSDENVTVNVDIYTNAVDTNGKPSRGSLSAREIKSKSEIDTRTDIKKVKAVKQQSENEGERESIIFVETVVDGATPTGLSLKKLENSVKKLQQQFQVLEELATNPELINKVKGNSTDPIKDMWQIININKRLDASEQGISKLTSMLQDIIKGDKIEIQNESDVPINLIDIDKRLLNLEENVKNLCDKNNSSPSDLNPESVSNNLQTNSKAEEIVNEPEKIVSNEEMKIVVQDRTKEKSKDFSEIDENINRLKNDIAQVRNDIAEIKSKFEETSDNLRSEKIKSVSENKELEKETDLGTKSIENKNTSNTSCKDKEEKIELQFDKNNDEKLLQCIEVVKNVETMYSEINELNARVDNLEKDTTRLTEITNKTPKEEINSDREQKIQKLQEEVEKLIQTNKIMEDKGNMNSDTNILREQIQVLKKKKVDKEDFEDALANKADTNTVSRKVSCDQFDAAREDLIRQLGEAFEKLNQQESIWQQALDEVHKEIECKLDKEEISPFKESIDNKFQRLQGKIKSLSEMREPSEAAGTKKMLRDVQCLSCDKDVVMRVHETNPIYATALSSFKTMKLRAPKKLQRKDLSHSETPLHEERNTKTTNSLRNSKNNFCNRYCGGSHTIIAPQQKIMRVGHFMNQWGPQVIQLPAGIIEGSDGKMYRSRLLAGDHNKEPKICDPCDNKCNSQRPSKETLAPQLIQQNVQKKGSYVSEGEEEAEKISIASHEEVSKHSNDEMTLAEEPFSPPPSPLEEKSLENKQLENNHKEPSNASKTMGVGSFFEESKSIAHVAFEDDDELEEIEEQDSR